MNVKITEPVCDGVEVRPGAFVKLTVSRHEGCHLWILSHITPCSKVV